MSHPEPEPRVASWRRYLRFWGTNVEADVDEELDFHRAMRVEDYVARGMTETDARAAVNARLGALDRVRSDCVATGNRMLRRRRRTHLVGAVRQDIGFGIRGLARRPGWSLLAVLTLGLGVGSATAVFSVVSTLVFHPIPYADAGRVVSLWRTDSASQLRRAVSWPMLNVWRARSRTLESIEPFSRRDVTLIGRGDPESMHAAFVTAEFRRFAGASLGAGRGFVADDMRPSAAPVAVISSSLAARLFGAVAAAPGKQVSVDGQPVTVVGVAAGGWALPLVAFQQSVDVWLPLTETMRTGTTAAMARLRAGVKPADATRELDELLRQAAAELPGSAGSRSLLVMPGDVPFRRSLLLLLAAVGLLLVVAVANVTHLLLARGTARQRELAIRSALGASRVRLVVLLVAESVLLAGCGGVAALVVAQLGLRALVAVRPPTLAPLDLATLDAPTLTLALAAALLSGVIAGLICAVQATRRDAGAHLRASSGTAYRRRSARALLIVAEVALSTVLLAAATLLVRTIVNLQGIAPGFDVEDLYATRFTLSPAHYPGVEQRVQFATRLLERARALPGVRGATLALGSPPAMGTDGGAWELTDGRRVQLRDGVTPAAVVRGDYFRVVQLALVSGRSFDAESDSRNEIIISRSLAERLWPGEAAVGRRVRHPDDGRTTGPTPPWMTVVGVASNTATLGFPEERDGPLVYYPTLTAAEGGVTTLIVRAARGVDPSGALRRLALELDPSSPPPAVTPVRRAMLEAVAARRFTMVLLGAFAAMAVVLTAVGLYGVISQTVAQRTREIGIRGALGGSRTQIARLVLGDSMRMCVAGLAIGVPAALWATRFARSLLFEVVSRDVLTYLVVAIGLAGVAFVASLPALIRAFRIDPQIAMRVE
ncbi:MAG TPA: ADOP family duplicated permease [Gemmatimonadaceae bacterium]|nr:ADOP family duplicated permease [Gemmatimonadaceae bacterium]